MANPSLSDLSRATPRTAPKPEAALGRQPQPDDDVNYTTSPFEAPRDSERPDVPGAPIDPRDRRGLFTRSAGTAVLVLAAILGAVGVVLTALVQLQISIPLFILAAGLVYVGRRMVRTSAEDVTQPRDRDPGRRRQPDFDD